MRQLLLLAPLLLLCTFFSVPAIAATEKKAASSGVRLGDPKELFLKRPPPVKHDPNAPKKKAAPSSLQDYWHNIKVDFSKVGEDLNKAANELSTLKKHTFHDPDFTPPPRPDWR